MLSQSLIATNVNNLAHPDGYRIVILYSPSSQVSSLHIATDPGFLMQPIYAPIDGNVAFACSGIGAQTSTDPLGPGDGRLAHILKDSVHHKVEPIRVPVVLYFSRALEVAAEYPHHAHFNSPRSAPRTKRFP